MFTGVSDQGESGAVLVAHLAVRKTLTLLFYALNPGITTQKARDRFVAASSHQENWIMHGLNLEPDHGLNLALDRGLNLVLHPSRGFPHAGHLQVELQVGASPLLSRRPRLL